MASPLEHYMYVLRCGDGNLYTGYAVDVEARMAAHRSGRGAKYTRAHAPVTLVAQARFYSKQRAMSAEAHFKQLTRARKDALLAIAAHEPLEDVLRRELPGFGEDTAGEFVCRELAAHVDPAYAAFMVPLIPSVDSRAIVGVRTPDLRRLARAFMGRGDVSTFLRALPHRLFEENQVHAFAIGEEHDYVRALRLYETFVPHIDNWATCDQLPVSTLAQRPAETLECVRGWLATGSCYPMRFAIGVLRRLFLGELFDPSQPRMVAASRLPGAPPRPTPGSDAYYVDMMRAWYFAEALVVQPKEALPYLERHAGKASLDEWTRRKAIQKALESRRIPADVKDRLRALR